MSVVAAVRTAQNVTADDIAACLARGTFKDSLVVVDRCFHLGDEADLLVVHHSLRYIDVEVKISRADLKADRRKSKWFHPPPPWRHDQPRPDHQPRDWPRSVWKHYYAMPASIWRDDLTDHCGRVSGILLVEPRAGLSPRHWPIRCVRRAQPDRTARPATAADLMAVARLASLRMWNAYEAIERARAGA